MNSLINPGTAAIQLNSLTSAANITNALGSPTRAVMNEQQRLKASQDFESMFISQMLEQMYGDSTGDDAFGDSETNEIYKGMMVEQYGKEISKAGGIGIADYVNKELLKLQEL